MTKYIGTLLQKTMNNMSEKELREWKHIEQQTSRTWRTFWIRVMKNHGHTNVQIAKEFEISESTVRATLKE